LTIVEPPFHGGNHIVPRHPGGRREIVDEIRVGDHLKVADRTVFWRQIFAKIPPFDIVTEVVQQHIDLVQCRVA